MDCFERVYHRDGYRCVYCGRFMLSDFDSWQSIHADHLVPASKGGPSSVENLVTSCPVCNILKGSFAPSEGFDPARREAYLQAIRQHIQARRAERMPRFFRLLAQLDRRYLPVE